MCTSRGRQCKPVPISGLRILVHPFPLDDITIKVPKCTKYEINMHIFCFISHILSFPSILCVDK